MEPQIQPRPRSLKELSIAISAIAEYRWALVKMAADIIACQCPPIIVVAGVVQPQTFDIPVDLRDEIKRAGMEWAELVAEFVARR